MSVLHFPLPFSEITPKNAPQTGNSNTSISFVRQVVSIMGGCCSKQANSSKADVELTNVKNEAMRVKCGLHGSDIKVTDNTDKHTILLQGSGIALGNKTENHNKSFQCY